MKTCEVGLWRVLQCSHVSIFVYVGLERMTKAVYAGFECFCLKMA